MGRRNKKLNLLVINGSMYDLLTQYQFFGQRQMPIENIDQKTIDCFRWALDNGATYQELHESLLNAFNNRIRFNVSLLNKKYKTENLIKQGQPYYHKELLIRNQMPTTIIDVEQGTITSTQHEYYTEQRASYTYDDFIDYIKRSLKYDEKYYQRTRIVGILKFLINTYGLDISLFCVEAAIREVEDPNRPYDIMKLNNCYPVAKELYEDAVNNFSLTGGERYVRRKRLLSM